jgi:SAM-dependent methyltransferase
MNHDFDKTYWDEHWHQRPDGVGPAENPYVARETASLTAGTALDAGCGAGAEAIWLAAQGWAVTAVDIAAGAFARATSHSTAVTWIEADLTSWVPGTQFDLVMTNYAHASLPQLLLYDRLAEWVAPGGTLLIVGHRHTHDHAHGDHPPAEASVTAAAIVERLLGWDIETAQEPDRSVPDRAEPLRDVVVRATRRS